MQTASKTKEVAFPLTILLYLSVKSLDSEYPQLVLLLSSYWKTFLQKVVLKFQLLSMDCMNINKTVVY
jgi:hypothetical protein